MFIVTVGGKRTWRRLTFLILLCMLAFLTSAFGGGKFLQVTAGAEDRPLTRADSPDDRVALTFDVTWGEVELKKILEELDRQDVKATFFIGGVFLNNHGESVRTLMAKGHEIGTLGQKIADLSGLPEQEVTSNLLASQSKFAKIMGGEVRYFRPPQGRATPAVVRAARAADLTTVTSSLDAEDYLTDRADVITRRVVSRARRGDIILLSASDYAKETSKALPKIIEGLKKRGFKLVRISELVDEASKPSTNGSEVTPNKIPHRLAEATGE